MTKQEKIKEAWGEYYDEVRDYLNDDGWLHKKVFSIREGFRYEDVASLGLFEHDIFLCRPKSLQGIEDNNGWVRTENGLPESNEPIWVMLKDLDIPQIVQPDKLGNYYGQDGNVYKESWITHYQPIVKPKLPVY